MQRSAQPAALLAGWHLPSQAVKPVELMFAKPFLAGFLGELAVPIKVAAV
ncbi:hypothetical protein I551_4599 [Mycobacterium ulcerans str. Harvey]|uniref:Uncharacterized protein n=1 Tax=Mycobacterium ulcerans str. Harvey TaxID=1299332 RepID=A0ABP3AH21_MYCUL|nr:hypothetical protein I551_4599 [Mycobacterium ulcerans str. Harvey]